MTENATIDQSSAATTRPLFRRSRTDRIVSGVCGGAAQSLGIDATVLRIALAAATVLGFGAGAVFYMVCWIMVPEADVLAEAGHSA